jgi:fibronectin type 3 domain-containing protein
MPISQITISGEIMVKVLKKNFRSFGILLGALMLAVSILGVAIPASAQNSTETEFINILNAHRITLNENTLAVNSNLSTAAYLHSKDMAENNYFSHISADGRTFDQRIIAAGYTNWTGLSENIAYYYGSPDATTIYNMWKNSAGHYANMIGNYTDAGLGVYTLDNYTYCTLDLGRRSSPPAPNFSLSASQSALNMAAGTSINSTITITSVNSFSGTVVLSNGSLPANWTAAFTPTSLAIASGGSKSSILLITTPTSAQTGRYTFTITGTSGSISHSAAITVNIQGTQNVPSVPLNLQAKAGSSQVALSWSAPSNSGSSVILNYRVYRRTASTSAALLATLSNVFSYNDSGAANGQTYYYSVTAVNSVGESPKSNEVHATPAASVAAPPDAASGLRASAVSYKQINLSWQDNSNNESGFKIERKKGLTGTFTLIAKAGVNVTSYSNTSLSANTTYFYRVRAYNTAGNSNYSNEVQVVTPPTPPQRPILKSPARTSKVSSLTPNLEWNPSTGAISYGLQVATNSTFTKLVVNQTGSGNTYYNIPPGVLNWNTIYYWRTNALNSGGNSSWSSCWYFKTGAGPLPNTASSLVSTGVSQKAINLSWQDNSNP